MGKPTAAGRSHRLEIAMHNVQGVQMSQSQYDFGRVQPSLPQPRALSEQWH